MFAGLHSHLLDLLPVLDKNKEKKRKITSATGAENRTMSQLIFNPNRCKK